MAETVGLWLIWAVMAAAAICALLAVVFFVRWLVGRR